MYRDLLVGTGAVATAGKEVAVSYVGTLMNGTQFDASSAPYSFRLGTRAVVAGFDEGITGMQAGGSRLVVIPPALGYGTRGAGGAIPPNATLVFEVELLGVG